MIVNTIYFQRGRRYADANTASSGVSRWRQAGAKADSAQSSHRTTAEFRHCVVLSADAVQAALHNGQNAGDARGFALRWRSALIVVVRVSVTA
jgi:hypothetical protein